jgi:hypothetical protein
MKAANHKLLVLALVTILSTAALNAQTFNSGSNGSDGALDFTGQTGTIVFNPASFNPPLDPDHDSVYHFTTIKIPTNLTVRLSAEVLGAAPVVWLASGTVDIAGTVDLSGMRGHRYDEAVVPSSAGAGGYPGGTGETPIQTWTLGKGPGTPRGSGSGAGHVVAGTGASTPDLNGMPYGNDFLLPMVGGSGGSGGPAGGSGVIGGGGGAGGGAFLLASSISINLSGSINANGGSGGFSNGAPTAHGGGGSGGSIRLIAPIISANFTSSLQAQGGQSSGAGIGSKGRIRIESYQHQFDGPIIPPPLLATPSPVFPPASTPAVRIVSIGGVAVPANPTASFVAPDVTLDNAATVTIQLAGSKIPVGTVVHLTLTPETGPTLNADSTPLAGTFDASTATASITVPHGFSRFSVQASWTP